MRLEEAVSLRPYLDTTGFWNAPARRNALDHSNVAYALHLLGRFDEESELGRHMLAEFPNQGVAAMNPQVRAAIGQGRLDEARRLVDQLESADRAAMGVGFSLSRAWIAAMELAGHGHDAEATAMRARAQRDIEAFLARGDTTRVALVDLANVLMYSTQVERLQALLPGVLRAGDTVMHGTFASFLAARTGDRAAVQRLQEGMLRLDPDSPFERANATYQAAFPSIYVGDLPRAMELLREARRLGFISHQYYHSDTDFLPLRGTPAFEEFTRPRKYGHATRALHAEHVLQLNFKWR